MEATLTIEETFKDLFNKHGESGTILKGFRAKEGLTQQALAELIGVSQTNISAIENGRRLIGKTIAKRIADVFKIDYRLFL